MRTRLKWLDITRGIGILLMVAGHMPTIPSLIHDWIFTFHMPIFFFTSGYFFKEKNVKDSLYTTARAYLVPYILYSMLFIGVDLVLFRNIGNLKESCIRMLIGQGGFDVLWFFMSLFIVHNFFNIICVLVKNERIQLFFVAVIVLVGYVLTIEKVGIIFKFSTSLVSVAFYSFGYYYKGYWENNENGLNRILQILGCIIVNSSMVFTIQKLNLPVLDINSQEYGNLLITSVAAFSGVLMVTSFSKLYEESKLMLPLAYIGENSLFFFPLVTYVPVRMISVIENYVAASTWLKLVSKGIGFLIAFGICECFFRIKRDQRGTRQWH